MNLLLLQFSLVSLFKQEFIFLLPEFIFSILILCLILWFSWLKFINFITRNILLKMILLILIFYFLLAFLSNDFTKVAYIFTNMFLVDFYSITFKLIIILTAICITLFTKSRNFSTFLELDWIPYLCFFIMAIFFMLLLVSVFDLFSFYLTLEGLSLCLYSIATLFIRHLKHGTEAAIKYFITGLLSTGFFLFGFFLLFVQTQQTTFSKIKQFYLDFNLEFSILPYIAIIFILFGFFFKLAVVPCHIWAPDVYESVPTIITAFFSITVKVAIFSVFIRILCFTFFDFLYFWQWCLMISSILSMGYGFANAAITDSLKRLIAYASINQVGYLLMALSTGTVIGIQSALIYLFVYLIMLIILFGLLLNTYSTSYNNAIINISDLSTLYKKDTLIGWMYFSVLLSMGGIPPFVGFFGKFYLFYAVIHSELYLLAFFGLIISALTMFIYLKIIKVAMFETITAYYVVYFNWTNFSSILIIVIFQLYIWFWGIFILIFELLIRFKFFAKYSSWVSFLFGYTEYLSNISLNPILPF